MAVPDAPVASSTGRSWLPYVLVLHCQTLPSEPRGLGVWEGVRGFHEGSNSFQGLEGMCRTLLSSGQVVCCRNLARKPEQIERSLTIMTAGATYTASSRRCHGGHIWNEPPRKPFQRGSASGSVATLELSPQLTSRSLTPRSSFPGESCVLYSRAHALPHMTRNEVASLRWPLAPRIGEEHHDNIRVPGPVTGRSSRCLSAGLSSAACLRICIPSLSPPCSCLCSATLSTRNQHGTTGERGVALRLVRYVLLPSELSCWSD